MQRMNRADYSSVRANYENFNKFPARNWIASRLKQNRRGGCFTRISQKAVVHSSLPNLFKNMLLEPTTSIVASVVGLVNIYEAAIL
jgi:hypothetical protein